MFMCEQYVMGYPLCKKLNHCDNVQKQFVYQPVHGGTGWQSFYSFPATV